MIKSQLTKPWFFDDSLSQFDKPWYRSHQKHTTFDSMLDLGCIMVDLQSERTKWYIFEAQRCGTKEFCGKNAQMTWDTSNPCETNGGFHQFPIISKNWIYHDFS